MIRVCVLPISGINRPGLSGLYVHFSLQSSVCLSRFRSLVKSALAVGSTGMGLPEDRVAFPCSLKITCFPEIRDAGIGRLFPMHDLELFD